MSEILLKVEFLNNENFEEVKMNAEKFFDFRTVAVVGASREEHKIGHVIFKNLLECKQVQAFPVNPKASKILGERTFKEILEIPYHLDCIIVAVKAEMVPEIMKQAEKKKVKSAIIISAGFAEVGNLTLEQEVKNIADRAGITLLGPNVLGFIDPYRDLNASFFKGMPEKGKIAFLSQSGALGTAILDWAIKEKIGFSGFVSLGNSAQIDFSDFIEQFEKDENTSIIALYIESLKEARGKRFIEACKKASKNKLIFAIKAGKSARGEKAALSHTAALASEKGVYEGIFKQAGIIEFESISEMFHAANAASKFGKLGRKACIVTNGGGIGVLCADSCEKNSIELPKLPNEIVEKLTKVLPKRFSYHNPVDILGDALAERYQQALGILDEEKSFDFFIILLTPQYMTEPLETAKILLTLKKPVFACFLGGDKVEHAKKLLLKSKVLLLDDVSEIGNVIGKIVKRD